MSLQGGSVPFFSSFLLTRPCTYLMAGTWAHIWMDTELLMIWSSHTNSGLSTSRSLHIRENQVSGFVVALVAKLCPTLCHPMNCSTPGSSVHGISQTRILVWVAIPFSRGSSQPKDRTCISCIDRQILYHWATREAHVLTRMAKEIKTDNTKCWLGYRTNVFIHCCWQCKMTLPESLKVSCKIILTPYQWLGSLNPGYLPTRNEK